MRLAILIIAAIIIPRLITPNCAASLISHRTMCVRRVSRSFARARGRKLHARLRNRRSFRNVRRVALTLIELVNPSAIRSCSRDKGTRAWEAAHRIRRVIRFYDFRIWRSECSLCCCCTRETSPEDECERMSTCTSQCMVYQRFIFSLLLTLSLSLSLAICARLYGSFI